MGVGVEPNLSILSGRDGAVISGSLHGDSRHSHRRGVLPLEQEEDTNRDPGGRELEAKAGEALKITVLYKTGRKKDP